MKYRQNTLNITNITPQQQNGRLSSINKSHILFFEGRMVIKSDPDPGKNQGLEKVNLILN